MKLFFLNSLATFLNSYKTLFGVRRIEDSLFRVSLDREDFYFDMKKGGSLVFVSPEKILGNSYQAPFDMALQKFCSRSELLSCSLDGYNQILIFEFFYRDQYKKERYFLHFEFTGKHTNVILVDEAQKVVEALRHIGENKSSRIIKPQKSFVPLAQPLKKYSLTPILTHGDIRGTLSENYKLHQETLIFAKKQHIISNKQKKIKDLQIRIKNLPNPSFLSQEAQKYALWGELIFSVKLPNYFLNQFCLTDYEGNEVAIVLPSKIYSYSQAGNFCFSQSKKYKQKLQNLEIQKDYLQSKLDFLEREIVYLQSLQTLKELQPFLPSKQLRKTEIQKDCESFFVGGIKVSIGRNSKENQRLLQNAKADDLWLHIQNIPSSHMIIHCGKQKVEDEVLFQSAKMLLAFNGIFDKNISIDYTQRRFVRVIEGANVIYSKQKTLSF